MRPRLLLALALLPLLASCGGAGRAPVYSYGQNIGSGAGYHTVSGGETLYRISTRYGLAMQDIVAANNLQPPYTLAPGQRLKLTPPRIYNVRPGDTLYNVAHAFGVSESAVARQNSLRAPYRLAAGSQLRLPSVTANAPAAVANNARGVGETFYLPPPAPGNEMPPPTLRPAGDIDREVLAAGPSAAPAAAPRTVYNFQPGLPPYDARNAGAYAPQLSGQPAASFAPASAISSPAGFIWPVEGRVISRYGASGDGIHNDGINIAAPGGAPVRAARAGTIVYAGRGVRAYGNLVLIRHDNGWVTAYAHMKRLLVSKGQRIAQGDAIGTVGATGSVSTEQLHFEVRRGTEALDPLQYLNRRTI
jgi:murein DD-endopeptidase MepM/ murein hydrolase activator NlpD